MEEAKKEAEAPPVVKVREGWIWTAIVEPSTRWGLIEIGWRCLMFGLGCGIVATLWRLTDKIDILIQVVRLRR